MAENSIAEQLENARISALQRLQVIEAEAAAIRKALGQETRKKRGRPEGSKSKDRKATTAE